MIFPIAHRINDHSYMKIEREVGIEFDVHAYGDKLTIAHDALQKGFPFEDFIQLNKDRFLAINVKEEGIEEDIIKAVLDIGKSDFFLFDVCFPQSYRIGKKYKEYIALRTSQLEKPDLSKCSLFSSYLIIDTFDGSFWMNEKDITEAKLLGYKLCFISPELHRPIIGDHLEFRTELLKYKSILDNNDSILTKKVGLWS